MVTRISSVEEYDKIINNPENAFVIIDFYADWCRPCLIIAPEYEKLAGKYVDKVAFCKINISDKEVDPIVKSANIQALPTFCLFYRSELVNYFVGGRLTEVINMIDYYLDYDFEKPDDEKIDDKKIDE